MTNFFADLYDGELIYSAIARQAYYNGNRGFKDVQKELFHKNSLIPTLTIGTHIESLLQEVSSIYSEEKLIYEHTIYPYYHPFLPEKRQKEIKKAIGEKGGSRIYLLLGNIAGGVCKKEGIYYCSECVQEDIERVGECYIHREHQLEGVLICPHHGLLLNKYCRDRTNTSRVEYIRLNHKLMNESDRIKLEIKEDERLALYNLSKMAYELITLKDRNIDRTLVLERYRVCLNKKGLMTSSGHIRQNELYEEFRSFYTERILELLNSTLNNDKEFNWLRMITRNSKRVIHPIRHLLFMKFLGLQVCDLIMECNEIESPFGKGPWPCLNKVASHYLEDVIPSVEIKPDYKTKTLIGTFCCSCGFIYSRSGPDKDEQDRYRIGRKKQFGKEWEKILYEKLSQGTYQLRELAREMDCVPKTIQKYDQKFKTYRYIGEKNKSSETKKQCNMLEEANNVQDLTEQYIKEIETLAKSKPELNRSQLRQKMQKQYSYLYRRDKEMLNTILPGIKKATVSRGKVDWDSRDEALVQLLSKVYKVLLLQRPTIRITLGRLAKPLGLEGKLYKWIEMNKLPKTKQYINKVVESVQDYQLRRCRLIIQEMKQKGEVIRAWKIQRKAGIRTKQFKKLLLKLTVDLID